MTAVQVPASSVRHEIWMDTRVTMQVLAPPGAEVNAALDRAMGWFGAVESACSRFDPASELRQLCAQVGVPVPVSALLFQAVQFAVEIARASGGAFDPTLGARLEQAGFVRNYRTGTAAASGLVVDDKVSVRDLVLDAHARTVTLRRPLLLDLGALAKGLAVDLAAAELRDWQNFAVDAGGDLYCGGRNAAGEPWRVGLRHPRGDGIIGEVAVSHQAVCTSGDYERRTPHRGHHILHPPDGRPASTVVSATVIAPSAMVADALATAAFVLGPNAGLRLFEEQGVAGVLFTPELKRYATSGL